MVFGLTLSGCSRSLLDGPQRAIAKQQISKLTPALPQAYAVSEREGSAGALVIVEPQQNHATVFAGNSPIEAMSRSQSTSFDVSSTCAFVYAYRAAIAPQIVSCKMLKAEAERFASIRAELDTSRGDIEKINVAIKKYDEALATSFRMGLVNSDLINAQRKQISELTSFTANNRAELSSLNAALTKLLEQFNSNTARLEEAISKLPK